MRWTFDLATFLSAGRFGRGCQIAVDAMTHRWVNAGALVVGLCVFGPGASMACTPLDPATPVIDTPIIIKADGSFQDASDWDNVTMLFGNPVRDIGGGRTGQVIATNGGGCQLMQSLIFVDCTAGQAIIVHGTDPAPGSTGDEAELLASTRALQPPDGPLSLTATTTVAEVAAIVVAQGWQAEADVPGLIAAMEPQNRYDPFFGCKAFYPDLPGASQ